MCVGREGACACVSGCLCMCLCVGASRVVVERQIGKVVHERTSRLYEGGVRRERRIRMRRQVW